MLQTVHHFLSTIMITFDALQKSDGHVSQQLDNLNRLAYDLVSKCGATVDDSITSPDDVASVMDSGIRMGPYTITVVKLKECVLSMGVSALEVFESLSQGEKNAVLRAISVLYLFALNGIMRIKVERNYYDQKFEAVPAYTPLKLVQVPAVDFVHVVRNTSLAFFIVSTNRYWPRSPISSSYWLKLWLTSPASRQRWRRQAVGHSTRCGPWWEVNVSLLCVSFAPVYLR